MSAATTKVLATAAGTQLCDCVVIGFTPDGDIHVDWTGTIARQPVPMAQTC
jgi:hypothetical protein